MEIRVSLSTHFLLAEGFPPSVLTVEEARSFSCFRLWILELFLWRLGTVHTGSCDLSICICLRFSPEVSSLYRSSHAGVASNTASSKVQASLSGPLLHWASCASCASCASSPVLHCTLRPCALFPYALATARLNCPMRLKNIEPAKNEKSSFNDAPNPFFVWTHSFAPPDPIKIPKFQNDVGCPIFFGGVFFHSPVTAGSHQDPKLSKLIGRPMFFLGMFFHSPGPVTTGCHHDPKLQNFDKFWMPQIFFWRVFFPKSCLHHWIPSKPHRFRTAVWFDIYIYIYFFVFTYISFSLIYLIIYTIYIEIQKGLSL